MRHRYNSNLTFGNLFIDVILEVYLCVYIFVLKYSNFIIHMHSFYVLINIAMYMIVT